MRVADVALALFALVCLAAITWPGYACLEVAGLGARGEPFVLGLPFSLAWNLAWVVLSFVALGLHYSVGRRARGGDEG